MGNDLPGDRGAEERLAALERAHRDAPGELAPLVELAAALARSGARARALDLVDEGRVLHESAALDALAEELLGPAPFPAEIRTREVGRSDLEVLCVALDTAETRVASGHAKGALRVAGLGAEAGVLELAAHRRSTTAAAFLPGGATMVTGGGDGTVRLWDVAARKKLRTMKGTASRAFRVGIHRGELVGGWRGEGYRSRGKEDPELVAQPFPGLLRPTLEEPARTAFFEAVYATLREWVPGIPRAVLVTPFQRLIRYSPEMDRRYAVAEDPRETAWGFVLRGRLRVLDVAGRLVLDVEDPRIQVPRGVEENRPPVFAVAPGGRAALLGSATRSPQELPPGEDPFPRGPGPKTRGALLVLAGDPPRVVPLLPDEEVTAVAFSPGGGMAALGTAAGGVVVAELRTDRRAPPAPLPATPVVEEAVPAWADLAEPLDPPAAAPADFALLRRVDLRRLGFAPRRVQAEATRVWILPPRTEPADANLPPEVTIAYRTFGEYDLASGGLNEPGYALYGDGRAYTLEYERRWLLLLREVLTPAPAGTPCPSLGDPPRFKAAGKAAVDAALGVKTTKWFHAPGGDLALVRARGRHRDVWILDKGAPEAAHHVPLPERIRDASFSPGGTRLALLLASAELWILGPPPA